MMPPIVIFYHGLFVIGDPPQPLVTAPSIVAEQMAQLTTSGLLAAAAEMHVGINGGKESVGFVDKLLPRKARVKYHGLESRSENLTIVMLEEWVKTHPGWFILYLHSKGATNPPGSNDAKVSPGWRRGMMDDVVINWKQCVNDLGAGHDIACSYWLWNAADGTQHIPAGNFLWIKSDFARKLPSIYARDRIKLSGIGALESRYESEVYWGNGPAPKVKTYRSRMWWWRFLTR